MAEDVASIIVCEACGDRAAELIVDGGTALCSECHLRNAGSGADGDSDLDE